MSKFYRRTGVTAFRFLIEAQIQKIELKLPKPDIYAQRISVIFKRGELRKETHNAPLMEDGQAYFAEKLAVPAVLYYDKRKKLFLPKEATLAVNLISKRCTKLMGVTRFDLSTFINSDIQEKDVVLKMEKCPDKNAKFHFKLVITQIKELGGTRGSMKMSMKDSVRSGSLRSSFKDASLLSLRESFKDTTLPLKVFAEEQPKLSSSGKKNNEDIDELYSYYTDSECSEHEEEQIKEVVEFEVPTETIGDKDGLACMTDSFHADESRSSQNKPEFCNVSTLEKTFSAFSSPNKNEGKVIEDELDEIQPQPEIYTLHPLEPERPLPSQSPDMRKCESRTDKRAYNAQELEHKVCTYEKEIVNLSNILLSGSQEFSSLKETHEQLKQDYDILNQKYEALLAQKNIQSPTKQGYEDMSQDSQGRILELENKLQLTESQNDLLNRMVQELEKTNQDYIVKLEKSIEKQAQPVYYNPQPNNIHQYKNMIDDAVHRLKEYKSIKSQDIKTCEEIMQELVNKLNESQESLLQLKENSKLEKQKAQKETEALEQGLQKIIREHETIKVRKQIKELHDSTSYDHHHHSQTMSFNSLKTREESLFDENLNSAHELSDHQGSGVKMHSGIFENAKAVSKAENAALKQEINYLSAKLLSMVNIQSKYEEQIKQRQHLQQENKSLKSELEKANKGWTYAEEERYELANKIKNNSSINTNTEDVEKSEYLEMEVFKLKSKMAELLNVVMEFGGADLSDKVEAIMTSEAGLNMEGGNNFMSFA